MEFITTTLLNPILGAIALLNTIPGFLAYTKKHKNKFHMYFIALNLSLVSWNIAIVLLNIYKSLLFAELTFITGACISLFFLWLSYYFAHEKRLTRKFQIITSLITGIIIIAALNNLIFTAMQPSGVTFAGEKGLLYGPFIICLGVYFIWGFYNIISSFPHCTILQRKQMLLFLLGWLVATGTTFMTNFILPFFGEYKGVVFGPLFSSSIIIYTTYAILRFRFMDITIILKRSAIIISLFATVLISLSVLAITVAQITGEKIFLIPAFALLFLCAHAIQSRIEKYVKRIFSEEVIDLPEFFEMMRYKINTAMLEQFIRELKEIMQRQYGIKVMVYFKTQEEDTFYFLANGKKQKSPYSKALSELFKCSKHTLSIDEVTAEKRQMKKLMQHNFALTIRLQGREGPIGIMLFGKKQNNESYSEKEKTEFETIAAHTSQTIEDIQNYEKSKIGCRLTAERLNQEI